MGNSSREFWGPSLRVIPMPSPSFTQITMSFRPVVGIVFLGRRRPGFDMAWSRSIEERVRESCGRAPEFICFEPPEKAVDEASLRRIMSACIERKVDAIAVLQPTMGDGRLLQTMIQLWSHPLILWATPENPQGDMVTCSLVGTHSWASMLRHMGHPFFIVSGAPDSPAVRQQLNEAVRMANTCRRLKAARLGMIGGHVPGFFAMGGDPFSIYHGLGVQVQTYTLVEFLDVVNGIDTASIEQDVAATRALGLQHKDTADEDLSLASRLYLALRAFFLNETLDALTIREWPELPNKTGQWPLLGVARLLDEGFPLAIEGDADGAILALMGESLGLGRSYLTDWLEHDESEITLWHGGAAPLSLCEPGAKLARHFNTGHPMAIDAIIRIGMPVTLARIWRLEGRYFVTAREGETVRPRREILATNARARLDRQRPDEWFEELCHLGMPHHVTLFQGRHEKLLRRFSRAMDAQFV